MHSRLILEPHRLVGESLEVAASYHPANQPGKIHRLWWRMPAEWQSSITASADPFVIAFLYPFMQDRSDVFVEGAVSPSLLQNLEAYMAIWHAWFPNLYYPVQIRAATETEPPAIAAPGQTIMPFSCGLDSSFTAFRHHRQLLGRRSRNITAALVMHGFDIRLDQAHSARLYENLLAHARPMLQSINVACIPLATNFHDLPMSWADSHGSHLAAALHLFSQRFDSALIPNSVTYTYLDRYWGTNPLTDPLFSRRGFRVFDDGGDTLRFEKAQLLAQWPEGLQHLRVCFNNAGNPASATNCCRCEKCALTLLDFRVAGVPRPGCFPTDITDRQLARVRMQRHLFVFARGSLVTAIRERNLHRTSWAKAFSTAIRRNKFRDRLRDLQRPFIPLRNRFRRLFRGSPLSKKERAQLSPASNTIDPPSANR